MRLSLLISILIHTIVLTSLLFVFRIVPEVKLPKKIYSVRILNAGASKKASSGKKKENEANKKKTVKVKKKAVPKPRKKKKKKVKKAENKEKPMEVKVKGDRGTSMKVDAARFPFSYYLEAVEGKVSRSWFGTAVSGSQGLRCVVYFRLQRDGSIDDVRIEQSSGNRYFDDSAVRAVRSSAPFPPLPRAFSGSYLGIHFVFVQKG